jgi:20S proteasome alpha/beta subunit
MTICLAVICEKRKTVIMISDAMITGEELSIEFEHRNPKIIKLANNCVVSTAGNALVHTELFDAVKEELGESVSPEISEVIECIKKCFANLRQRDIEERILKPKGFPDIQAFYGMQGSLVREVALSIQNDIDTYEYGLDVLVGGVDSKGAHIFSVSDPGTSVAFDAIGYNAIGSGETHAITTLIANEYHEQFRLPEALLMAYQAKKIAERAPGVGSKITTIAVVTNKKVRFLTAEETRDLDVVYAKRLEAEEKWKREHDWGEELKKLVKGLAI